MSLLVFAIAQTLIGPVLPEMAGEFGAGLGRIGILFTFNFIGFCTALSLSSCRSGKVPKSRLFSLSGLGLGISLLAFAAAPSLSLACLAMFFIGGCGGNVESLGSAVLADLNPERVGSVLNIFLGGLGLSGLWPTILAYGVGKYSQHSVVAFNSIVAAGGLGGCFVPWLMGIIAEARGFRSGLILLVGLELLIIDRVASIDAMQALSRQGSRHSAIRPSFRQRWTPRARAKFLSHTEGFWPYNAKDYLCIVV